MSAATFAPPPQPARPTRPHRLSVAVAAALVVAMVLWAVVGLDVKWNRLLEAPQDIYRVFELMFTQMSWSTVGGSLEAMWDSVAIAWLGTLLAAVVAVPFGFMAAENLVPRWYSFGFRQVFNLLRSVPEIVIVLTMVPVFGLTKTAGIIAIGIGSIGTLSKLCSEVVEGIDRGPIEAADAVGATQLQRLRWAVLPQAIPEIASFVLYRFEINIRVSAILGVVGAGGIGNELVQSLKFKAWDRAGVPLLVVVIVTMLIDAISGAVRRRILAGPARRTAADPEAAAADPLLVANEV
ncbi:phosphonate ABC transporter, permease protein PhnE [soil metagenome]